MLKVRFESSAHADDVCELCTVRTSHSTHVAQMHARKCCSRICSSSRRAQHSRFCLTLLYRTFSRTLPEFKLLYLITHCELANGTASTHLSSIFERRWSADRASMACSKRVALNLGVHQIAMQTASASSTRSSCVVEFRFNSVGLSVSGHRLQ